MTFLDPSLIALNDCGGCAGSGSATPATIFNRPGLSVIAYRSGGWHEFRSALLAALAQGKHPPLAALTTRENDDFTLALLDAWAGVADVLTFYQERIAQENWLRTATERRSVLELARLIGYELGSGVAAQTLLAFTIEEAPGAPHAATLDAGVKVQSIPGQDEKAQTFETVEKIEARAEWNAMRPRLTHWQNLVKTSDHVWLAGTATNLRPGDALLLVGEERASKNTGDERWDFRRVTAVTPDAANNRTRVDWERGLGSSTPFMLPASNPRIYVLRQRAALFGHNAINPRLLPDQARSFYSSKISGGAANPVDWTFACPGDRTIALDAACPGIRASTPGRDSWIVLSRPYYQELYKVTSAIEAAQSDYALSGKTTQLVLDTDENLSTFFAGNLRATMVFGESEELQQAEVPLPPTLAQGTTTLTLDSDAGALPRGRVLLVSGMHPDTGATQIESVTLDAANAVTLNHTSPPLNVTQLVFRTALQNDYRLDTVKIYGNVALATHGEAAREVLGSGDGSKINQRFVLRQPPLTYVRSANAPNGGLSTLEVRVNDLLWHEVPSFYGHGPEERIYVTRQDDNGNVVVMFGDGNCGARLPTGQENVRAVYRKGIGAAGNVRAGQLGNLLTRPLGLKEALNPLPASGGDDPEARDAARGNAPLKVLALDRVVSLGDYQNFARAYLGIAKALATWSWDGERRGVFVTVAAPGGTAVDDSTLSLLGGAMRNAGDPYVPIRIQTFRKAVFHVAYKIKPDAGFDRERVFAATVAALRERFSFAARAFGQAVTLSEVIATLQSVPGVLAVDVDTLRRSDDPAAAPVVDFLPAALPQADSLFGTLAAELLVLSDDPIAPGEMT